MGHRERILEYLRQHPEGADDSELTRVLNIPNHASTNQRCRALAEEGLIERRQVGRTLHNYLVGAADVENPQLQQEPAPEKPWFWEGHVQAAVVDYLSAHGYRIVRVADTASRETGKDIVARGPSGLLWVTTKGFPEGTPRTQPSTQAGHWFKDALFDMVAWHGEDSDAELALALPDYPRYRSLAQKVAWLQSATPFLYLWVKEDGTVTVERPVS